MKNLWIVAVAVAMFTACASESDVYVANDGVKQEIGFAGLNYGLTRNLPADGETFATTNKMYVSAVYNSAATPSVSETYFSDVEFAYDGTSVWRSTPAYYYPFTGTMDFYAFSAASDLSTGTGYGWTLDTDRKVKINGQALTGVDDVLYSTAKNVTCATSVTAQELTFNHALAWLYIKFKTTDTTPADIIKINSVKISNVILKGDLTVDYITPANTGWDNEAAAEEFTFAAPSGDFTLAGTTAVDWNTTGALVLPQTGSADTKITIEYQIKKDATNWYTPSTYTTSAITTSWVAGSKYTYEFEIGLSEITFTGKVSTFGDVGPTTITL